MLTVDAYEEKRAHQRGQDHQSQAARRQGTDGFTHWSNNGRGTYLSGISRKDQAAPTWERIQQLHYRRCSIRAIARRVGSVQ